MCGVREGQVSLRDETFACPACDAMRTIAVLPLNESGFVFAGMYCRRCRELRSPDGLLEQRFEGGAQACVEEALFA